MCSSDLACTCAALFLIEAATPAVDIADHKTGLVLAPINALSKVAHGVIGKHLNAAHASITEHAPACGEPEARHHASICTALLQVSVAMGTQTNTATTNVGWKYITLLVKKYNRELTPHLQVCSPAPARVFCPAARKGAL